MDSKLTEEQALAAGVVQADPDETQASQKKKPSWLHTILWMLSMVLLVNMVMAVVAYFLFFYKK